MGFGEDKIEGQRKKTEGFDCFLVQLPCTFLSTRKLFLACETKKPVSSWSTPLSAFSLIAIVELRCDFDIADKDLEL